MSSGVGDHSLCLTAERESRLDDRLLHDGARVRQRSLEPRLTCAAQLVRKPAIMEADRLPRLKTGVRFAPLGGWALDTCAVAQRRLVHRVGTPPLPFRAIDARADRKHETPSTAGADDHVVRTWRAVDKVPLPERPLFSLDDEKRFTRENEEILLVDFPVVHRHRHARL